ncbi:hypothetical protein K470DRAFT_251119 [Piedraia hortae CBS 480.64]|uniref:PAC domain-containing protein n=1 Tax=Piedraia hortae CBS 480.64 TaxID=1314780 RepID=A0A6A7BUY4_9PEZI|nr:hypothetical protein K470DRAFT_251119 [Piedraia hortae CBS 480.64]
MLKTDHGKPSTSWVRASVPSTPEILSPREHSSANSPHSQETVITTPQSTSVDISTLESVMEDDPESFDLLPPSLPHQTEVNVLEKKAEQVFSQAHLQAIFDNPKQLREFIGSLNQRRPQSIPILVYYLDALKALRAIRYSNAVAEALEFNAKLPLTQGRVPPTRNPVLEEKASQAFNLLVDELPGYIVHVWTKIMRQSALNSITQRTEGAPSNNLAEAFCLADPSRADTPLVFISEEFARMTQYSPSFLIGKNCRFLQGPATNKATDAAKRRMAEACSCSKEITELVLNFRRDGSPFMNLITIAPLVDSRGALKYFLGVATDVSHLLATTTGLGPLHSPNDKKRDELRGLSEMLTATEQETVRRFAGRMHTTTTTNTTTTITTYPSDYEIESELSTPISSCSSENLSLPKEPTSPTLSHLGIFDQYLLIRPSPSLRILFTSPTLRVPGILQSPFLSRIGGSDSVRTSLSDAFTQGRGITAKVKWLTRPRPGSSGMKHRWIRCVPLLNAAGVVGVWIIIVVDDDSCVAVRAFKDPPPVDNVIGKGKVDCDDEGKAAGVGHIALQFAG